MRTWGQKQYDTKGAARQSLRIQRRKSSVARRGFIFVSVAVLVFTSLGTDLPMQVVRWTHQAIERHNATVAASRPLAGSSALLATASDAVPAKTGDISDPTKFWIPSLRLDPANTKQLGSPLRTDKDAPAFTDTERFSYVPRLGDTAAFQTSRTPKAVKLLDEGRTAYDKVYQNDDGTKTLRRSVAPTSYREGATWKDIDLTLLQYRTHPH